MTDPISTPPAVDVVTTPGEVTVTVTVAAPAELAHAQAVPVASGEEDFYPPHPPRSETPEYTATHHLLVNVLDTPCRICGVRTSTLGDPRQNIYDTTALETHHYPCQREFTDAIDWRKVAREFTDAIDWRKVARDFTQVVDQASLLKFIDSPANMWVLCSHCHRDPRDGVHHAVLADFIIHRYLFDGYVLTDLAANAAKDLALDQAIVDAAVPVGERM